MASSDRRLEAIVSGRVQNVGYRYFVQMAAIGLHINGRVANAPGGRVSIIAEGPAEALEQFISAMWQGPRSAHVDRVEEIWSDATGEFSEFAVGPDL